MKIPLYVMEQKPRIIFSQQCENTFGGGWICYFFEGAMVHKTFNLALKCVLDYWAYDYIMSATPPNQHIH